MTLPERSSRELGQKLVEEIKRRWENIRRQYGRTSIELQGTVDIRDLLAHIAALEARVEELNRNVAALRAVAEAARKVADSHSVSYVRGKRILSLDYQDQDVMDLIDALAALDREAGR